MRRHRRVGAIARRRCRIRRGARTPASWSSTCHRARRRRVPRCGWGRWRPVGGGRGLGGGEREHRRWARSHRLIGDPAVAPSTDLVAEERRASQPAQPDRAGRDHSTVGDPIAPGRRHLDHVAVPVGVHLQRGVEERQRCPPLTAGPVQLPPSARVDDDVPTRSDRQPPHGDLGRGHRRLPPPERAARGGDPSRARHSSIHDPRRSVKVMVRTAPRPASNRRATDSAPITGDVQMNLHPVVRSRYRMQVHLDCQRRHRVPTSPRG